MKAFALIVCSVMSLLGSAGWMMHGMDAAHKRVVLSHARGVADVLAQSRQVYAEHRSDQDALPITFARDLAKRIQTAEVKIYSPYPFPSNSNGGLSNGFEYAAWNRLAEHGDSEYLAWESGVLRYAVPDVMSEKCVECHNTAKGTPKADWKVGDVRGVIEVTLPY